MAKGIEHKEYLVEFDDWCEVKNAKVAEGRDLSVMSSKDGRVADACKRVAAVVPGHYASPERVAAILQKLGKEKAAAYLRDKLPKAKRIRSGDLGEVLATQYIDECSGYRAPIKRLRWKDHREMSMRGDDVIGVAQADVNPAIKFLKTEVKSRASLSKDAVAEARQALNDNGGMPSPHALAFVSDRLHEAGAEELADLIVLAQLKDGIAHAQVQHLLFTFSGNAPDALLRTDLENYDGPLRQNAVGLRINDHQKFIAAVYEAVETDHES
jgi:hypothetical protein